MSPEQDSPDPDQDAVAQAMREAEEAVDKVRSESQSGVYDVASDDTDDGIEVVDDFVDLEAKLAEAEAETAALKDKWLRAVADNENYKKRVKRDIDDAIHRAVQGLLGNFLPVGDNLERALSVAPADGGEALTPLIKGLEMVRQEFLSALAKHGIKPIESVGQPFDPSVHDALQQMDSPDYPPGTVMIEYEKGYVRGDKLLRPARVIVAGPGSTGAPAPASAEAAGEPASKAGAAGDNEAN
ncbi:Heat shock protein GrpE [Enhygromyxa salina]|uniref:Protein GrpE n=1 Tax=Enhygromyxa salina TaxID=215803 RepID=A0A0C1ZMX8_9BACT|nr:nucleotide exchange factor GrpE [Enhygromyxa salina]KIG12438.1 Heat shock protein GrpE [Enhygromyxa salina]